jgi:hypothetical protein
METDRPAFCLREIASCLVVGRFKRPDGIYTCAIACNPLTRHKEVLKLWAQPGCLDVSVTSLMQTYQEDKKS